MPDYERIFKRLNLNLSRAQRAAQHMHQPPGELQAALTNLQHDLDLAQHDLDGLTAKVEGIPELVRVMSLINSSLDLDIVLEGVLDTVITLTEAERAYLMLYEADGSLAIQTARNWDQTNSSEAEIAFSRSVIETVIETQEPVFMLNTRTDARFRDKTSILRHDLYAVTCIPMLLREQVIGALWTDNRRHPIQSSPDYLPLLTLFAQQAAIAIENARLFQQVHEQAQNLQRSRERLVITREEERRRLRRDLHDGLGPTLASFTLRLDRVRTLVTSDPDRAETVLSELKTSIQEAIQDIRRLIYELRPPALDELGLVGALNRYSDGLRASGLRIQLEAPDPFPALSAAVEVALYRIITEALTNVVRHSQAQQAQVTMFCEDAVIVEIRDDGRGLPANIHPGVGLNSMRERATELGGDCSIESLPEGGTRVLARLPLGEFP